MAVYNIDENLTPVLLSATKQHALVVSHLLVLVLLLLVSTKTMLVMLAKSIKKINGTPPTQEAY